MALDGALPPKKDLSFTAEINRVAADARYKVSLKALIDASIGLISDLSSSNA